MLEIACLILVGERIGVLATIALIFATSALGALLLRVQGFGLLTRIRREMDAGRVPSRELAHGVVIVVAGILLIIPGFISDVLGILLFVPGFRDLGWRMVGRRIRVFTGPYGRRPGPAANDRVIDLDEGDYSREPEDERSRLPEDRR